MGDEIGRKNMAITAVNVESYIVYERSVVYEGAVKLVKDLLVGGGAVNFSEERTNQETSVKNLAVKKSILKVINTIILIYLPCVFTTIRWANPIC